MSSQRGNTQRTRPQKHQNNFAFKNSLHDTSKKTKIINNIQVNNVCERCKKIIEWKIKYKKYKPLKAAAKCNKCEQKTVKHAYHSMCGPCARERDVCPKCESKTEIINLPTKEDQFKLDLEMQQMLKTLPERKRRTFIRYMNKQADGKKKGKKDTDEETNSNSKEITNSSSEKKEELTEESTREHLMNKLKSMMIDVDDDNISDDLDDFLDENDEDDCESDDNDSKDDSDND